MIEKKEISGEKNESNKRKRKAEGKSVKRTKYEKNMRKEKQVMLITQREKKRKRTNCKTILDGYMKKRKHIVNLAS